MPNYVRDRRISGQTLCWSFCASFGFVCVWLVSFGFRCFCLVLVCFGLVLWVFVVFGWFLFVLVPCVLRLLACAFHFVPSAELCERREALRTDSMLVILCLVPIYVRDGRLSEQTTSQVLRFLRFLCEKKGALWICGIETMHYLTSCCCPVPIYVRDGRLSEQTPHYIYIIQICA